MNQSRAQFESWVADYEALLHAVGLIDLSARTQIELTGADRATFLHNLCTNDVRKLAVGSGCEAFLTNVQGKVVGHVLVFAGPDSLVLDTVPGQAERLLAHLDRYLVCEQVTIVDRTSEWGELLLAGAKAERWAREHFDMHSGESRFANHMASLDGRRVWIRRCEMAGPGGLLVSAAVDDLAALRDRFVEHGAKVCATEAFEAARIEQGFPWFGRDISDQNLAQEVGRDAQAISFVKGCYLGQETVARIDALGHVNRLLVGLRFAGATVPEAGQELSADGQPAGVVTSATFSPRLNAPLALGYVRRRHNEPGSRLTSNLGEVEVVRLPLG